MDKKNLLKLRSTEPEIYDRLFKISLNFRKLNALFKCLEVQLSEKEIFTDKETAHLFDIVKIIMTQTLKDFEKIEDDLNL